ncbi:MAG TPA: hypothetical protein VLM75_14900 [Spirochaetota bacterium]|nr:hypothetical protein [Spirochaetota bacterium]
MNAWRRVALLAVFAASVLSWSGCGGLKGEFAVKRPFADEYHRVTGIPEFSAAERIDWVYVFSNVTEEHAIGVILMKKELVWVDVSVRTERIDVVQKVIYGAIEGLDKGVYRLLVAEKGKILGEMEFVVYDEAHDDEADITEHK